MALGGYGRKELCPHSDIDILVIYSEKSYSLIEKMVRFFWDCGLNPGCVVRTLAQCRQILGEDIATDTAYLHARFLCGNPQMFDELSRKILKPYFKKRKNHFIQLFRQELLNKIQKPVDSIYHVEPDLKNGICALRDCHRLLWAEMLRTGASSFYELELQSNFKKNDVQSFKSAYDFLLNLRNELHIYTGRRIDILEVALQPEIASIMGFQLTGEILEEYFKQIRNIKNFISLFLEKSPAGEGLFYRIRRNFSSVEIDYNMYMVDGIIYPVMRYFQQPRIPPLPEEILHYFELASIYKAYLSYEFCNIIRALAHRLPTRKFFTDEVFEVFERILRRENIGPILMLMHETHILEKIIPEFQTLVCKVEYDTYHELTADQHILLAVAHLDHFEETESKELNLIYRSLPNKFLLKMVILLHDIGKALEGDHSQTGAIVAQNICIRLGLSDGDTDKIRFLILNHLLMSNISFEVEFEPRVIEDFANRVGTKEKLDMLYVLTVIDIKNVGKKAWSQWKGVQLKELYDKTLEYLENDHTSPDYKLHHPFEMSPFLASDLEHHEIWLNEFYALNDQKAILVKIEKFIGFLRITFIAKDRSGLFLDITGCLTSEAYNILSANGYTSKQGDVVDVFHVEADENMTLTTMEIKTRIENKWKKITEQGVPVRQLIDKHLKLYPLKKSERRKSEKTQILLDNKTSQYFTLLQISTNDRFKLLFTIAEIINRLDLNIVSAKLSSRIGFAKDSFYITDSRSNKIENPDLQEQLKKELWRNIDTIT
ncbi:MAG: HD domain-containing protein [Spirochaetales bacterium]|nr:HD domain-containing protein [Spirochaetales bacterium]